MQNQQVTPEQVQAAATAGLKILGDKDLKVSMEVAMSGNLPILNALLASLAAGQVVLSPPAPQGVEDEPNEGEQESAGPKAVS